MSPSMSHSSIEKGEGNMKERQDDEDDKKVSTFAVIMKKKLGTLSLFPRPFSDD